MNRKQLVLVTTRDEKTTIPLDSIFDIAVGGTSNDLSAVATDMVMIGFTRGVERRIAVIGADSDTVDRFTSVLFKAELNGSTVTVKHPARVDGQVVNTTPRTAAVKLQDRAVAFTGIEDPFTIDLPSVTNFERTERTIAGRTRPALHVRYVVDGRPMTTEVVVTSRRKMNILGRYLRLEYREIMTELDDLGITEEEMNVLVALFLDDGSTDLARLREKDASAVAPLLKSLQEKNLIVKSDESTELTPQGRMIASARIGNIDA